MLLVLGRTLQSDLTPESSAVQMSEDKKDTSNLNVLTCSVGNDGLFRNILPWGLISLSYLLCCSQMLDISPHYHSETKLGQQESSDVSHHSLDSSLITVLYLRSASAC